MNLKPKVSNCIEQSSNKPEPLKGKIIGERNYNAIAIEDIKSAVEWLKKKIYDTRLIHHPISNNDLYKIIDKAFEDVTK